MLIELGDRLCFENICAKYKKKIYLKTSDITKLRIIFFNFMTTIQM